MYDITCRRSFDNLDFWVSNIKEVSVVNLCVSNIKEVSVVNLCVSL